MWQVRNTDRGEPRDVPCRPINSGHYFTATGIQNNIFRSKPKEMVIELAVLSGFQPKILALISMTSLSVLSISNTIAAPPIDPARASITLKRSTCYGPCPAYEVKIHGDGRVQFSTETASMAEVDPARRKFASSEGVLLPGTHEDWITPEAVKDLIGKFQAAGFWHLKNEYIIGIVDLPTYSLTIDTGQQRKTVVEQAGSRWVRMPPVVTDLQNATDQVAGTDRWVIGSPALISWLERVRFDFRSPHAAELAAAGEWGKASEAMVGALIDRGAPLDQPVSPGGITMLETEAAGMSLIKAAIKRGHAGVFNRLMALGWLDRLGKLKAAEYFAQSAAGCSPALVDAVADAGVDIDLSAPPPPNDYLPDSRGRTALARLQTSHACQDDEARRAQTVARLIARGAKPKPS
ncbi:DUF6438 domain-containing protein [Iodidimonas sp. SYSU 1G8]|uniref:DUF6438 domain-containing protein n=1 Tax=Iodidimonas sp. SYSU 1G8 TaxID=3133967 RepID=UPI0031FEE74C